ncbi:hypothetical protein [Campylobacter sp. MG1]|uniref:hypothetical protein n=1 Tax=Campylobacter sp. MG1 TaxID=2976332 RepID=UPI00226CA255|nr:hypothetical protein [Campylobacter sp. MG1]
MSDVIDMSLSFSEKQAVAYAFLKAFYTREELGYSVDDYEAKDVTPKIIEIVNQMGKDIIRTNRIIQSANVFKTLAEGLGSKVEFIAALVDLIASGSGSSLLDAVNVSEDTLIKERKLIRRNVLAYNMMKVILAREKTNIELSFQGII